MGGATSKYEETDWIQADGKLKGAEETIDGRPPTTQYGVYYVTKTKMNQRVRCLRFRGVAVLALLLFFWCC